MSTIRRRGVTTAVYGTVTAVFSDMSRAGNRQNSRGSWDDRKPGEENRPTIRIACSPGRDRLRRSSTPFQRENIRTNCENKMRAHSERAERTGEVSPRCVTCHRGRGTRCGSAERTANRGGQRGPMRLPDLVRGSGGDRRPKEGGYSRAFGGKKEALGRRDDRGDPEGTLRPGTSRPNGDRHERESNAARLLSGTGDQGQQPCSVQHPSPN